MRELLLPVAEGVGTRSWLIERRIKLFEDQLRAWAVEPNPPLARAEAVERLEDYVCRLYEELEAAERLPRPREVAQEIERLTEEDFRRYLGLFSDEQTVGWAARLEGCPIALYITHGTMFRTDGLRLRVLLDHALIDDGFDEVRAELPSWAERIARATTPPEYPGEAGEAVAAGYVRGVLDANVHGRQFPAPCQAHCLPAHPPALSSGNELETAPCGPQVPLSES